MSNNYDSTKRYNFATLTILQLGSFIGIPCIMVGFMLGKQYGIYSAILNLLIGNICITILIMIVANEATKHRQTTSEIVIAILGEKGAKIAGGSLAIVLCGWFAINLNFMSVTILSINNYYNSTINRILINLIIGFIIIITVKNGINKVRQVARLAIPLFILSIIITIFSLYSNNNQLFEANTVNLLIIPEALLMVIAAPFTMIFDAPTYYRFAATKRDSMISTVMTCTISMSAIEIVGVIFAVQSNSSDLPSLFTSINSFFIVGINVISILVSSYSVNNSNLYVSAVNTATLLSKFNFIYRVIFLGIIATSLSFIDVFKYFADYLNAMMILIASITSLVILKALNVSKIFNQQIAVIAIIIGSIFGFASITGLIKLYNFSFIEGFVMTMFSYLLLIKLKKYGVYFYGSKNSD